VKSKTEESLKEENPTPDLVRRMQYDHQSMMTRKRLDFVITGRTMSTNNKVGSFQALCLDWLSAYPGRIQSIP
jgi:hypothetical protein